MGCAKPKAKPDASATTLQEAISMLDIHAPHGADHTWKGFFIHIATIVVGLLIAIGLEQAVEYLHHRHQAREMADRLRQESSDNREVAKYDIEIADQIITAIEANMEALKSARTNVGNSTFSPTPLPDDKFYLPADAAWITARDSALLPIVAPTLVANYWKIETTIQGIALRYHNSIGSRNHANGLLNLQSGTTTLTLEASDALIVALSEYREHLRGSRRLLLAFLAANDLALAGKTIDSTSVRPSRGQPTQPN
jgi:hypothetical protein